MSDPLPGISVREAAIHFGTSESDIRRRIKRGDLRAESIARPGGTLLRVLIDAPGAAPTTDPIRETAPAPEPLQDAPAAIVGLLELIASDRETIAEKDRLLAEMAERVGALREEVGQLRGERDRLAADLTWERRPWWCKLWAGARQPE
jgi:hypothetical protein